VSFTCSFHAFYYMLALGLGLLWTRLGYPWTPPHGYVWPLVNEYPHGVRTERTIAADVRHIIQVRLALQKANENVALSQSTYTPYACPALEDKID